MKIYKDNKKVIIHTDKALELNAKSLVTSHLFNEMLEDYMLKVNSYVDAPLLLEVYQKIILDETYLNELRTDLKEEIFTISEGFYDFWRKKEKYLVCTEGNLVDVSNMINEVIIRTYRLITEGMSGKKNNVYRQLSAGFNLVLGNTQTNMFEGKLAFLNDVICINQMVIRPPFIIRTKSNKREGVFKQTESDIIATLGSLDDFYMLPIKVGRELALVYVSNKYLHHGVSLSSLFEIASTLELYTLKPSLMIFFGLSDNQFDNQFQIDKESGHYIGVISDKDKNDYFGYMKKMLLTLHNLKKIDEGYLPIHGAMAKVTFNDNSVKNIMMIGDSGAGKSETLEALGAISEGQIKSFDIIFDDMGYMATRDSNLYASGTEIGAFVRIDDLDDGYIYREFDRSIFLNPERHNARLIIPVSMYQFIRRDHKIDMVLYINNYEANEVVLSQFKDLEQAKAVFIEGLRMAKGTTAENGLVSSFFSNPFGPVQKEMTTRFLIDKYFKMLYDQEIYVGILHTKLGIDGFSELGPRIAAKALLDFFNNVV